MAGRVGIAAACWLHTRGCRGCGYGSCGGGAGNGRPLLAVVHLIPDHPDLTARAGRDEVSDAARKIGGKTIVSAIQPNAADQAYIAAMNMVGRKAVLKGVTQINVLDTLGLISTSFGHWQGVDGGEHVELTDRPAGRHLSLQFKDDVMVGCNSIGWTEHVGVMRGLVEGQVKLGEWKDRLKHDPTLLMEAYLASAQGQSARALVPPK